MTIKPHKSGLPGAARSLGVVVLYVLGLLSTIATGGGGGDGDGDDGGEVINQTPNISGLELATAAVEYLEGDGDTAVTVSIAYSDPEGDITTLSIETSAGSSVAIPVAVTGSSGRISGEVPVSTDRAGDVTIEVWIVDSAGNNSNRLSASIVPLLRNRSPTFGPA